MKIKKLSEDAVYYMLITLCAALVCTPLLLGIVDTIKDVSIFLRVIITLAAVVSGVLIFGFITQLTKLKYMGFIAAILYITIPYRITDIYLRTAVTEIISFIFIPLVFWGLYNIFNSNIKKGYYFAIGAIGLVLTHNITAVYTLAFALIYIIIEFKKLKDKSILKSLGIYLIFTILTTSFLWLTMLEHFQTTKYQLFELDKFVVKPLYNLGIPVLALFILTVIKSKNISTEYKKIFNIFIIFGIISAVTSCSAFFLSVSLSIGLGTILRKGSIISNLIVLAVCTVYAVIMIFICNKIVEYNKVDFRTEYLPVKTTENLDYYKSRQEQIYVLEGEAVTYEYNKKGNKLNTKIEIMYDNTIIELPYVYYLGYVVKINGGQAEIFEDKNGFIALKIEEKMKGELSVEYKGTILIWTGVAVSIVSLIVLIYIVKKEAYLWKTKVKE